MDGRLRGHDEEREEFGRWQIELFFRWVKQVLKIKKFLKPSENAVRIQLAVAMIAFLLLRIARAAQKVSASLLAFTRRVHANLMHPRTIHNRAQVDQQPTPPAPTAHLNLVSQ